MKMKRTWTEDYQAVTKVTCNNAYPDCIGDLCHSCFACDRQEDLEFQRIGTPYPMCHPDTCYAFNTEQECEGCNK